METVIRRKLTIAILIGTFAVIVALFLHKPIGQDLSYHDFCDTRPFIGIPNFANVISNLPFLAIGIGGFITLRRETRATQKGISATLFTGIILTGIGSAWYHLAPDNNRLVFDRLPMTIIFMSVLAYAIQTAISDRAGAILLGPLLAAGIAAIYWWHTTGDLRPYILVQYYPLLLIPLLLSLHPAGRRNLRALGLAVAWYMAAKIFEFFDCAIFTVTHVVSGHTLKHLSAAAATLYISLSNHKNRTLCRKN